MIFALTLTLAVLAIFLLLASWFAEDQGWERADRAALIGAGILTTITVLISVGALLWVVWADALA